MVLLDCGDNGSSDGAAVIKSLGAVPGNLPECLRQLRLFEDLAGLVGSGEIFKQPELAKTLRQIARDGPKAFYHGGAIAAAIVATIQKYHGLIAASDLEHYQAKLREPLAGHFRGFTIL